MTSASPTDPHPADPNRPEHWALRRLRVFWLVVPLIVILGALMLSDLGDFMGYSPFPSNPCSLTFTNQSSISARMYMPIAKWALRYTPTPRVAIIYVDPAHDPPDLLTNVCASRAFLARLVPDLKALGAQIIVIDKYYSAAACAEPEKNAAFIKAMDSSRIPVVVGQSTEPLSGSSSAAGCLALTPRLEFSKTSRVLYGLTLVDTDVLKIPLRFQVFPVPAENETVPGASQPAQSNPPPAPKPLPDAAGDTLSLVAAKAVDPGLELNPTLRKQLAKQADPYTTFLDLPNITALTALCSAEASPRADIDGQPGDALCKPWVRDPNNLNGRQLSLNSKIVVIGDLSDLDMKLFPTDLAPFPPGQRPGVFLQANYIQALLDHRFLLEVPMPITVSVLVLYVLVVYCLYWAHDEAGKPRLSVDQAGLGSLVVLAGIVLISFLALVTMSYFTPLWALWGGGVFMVFRYLEAKGHHRSQHLLGHLAGHHHAAAQPMAGPAAEHTGSNDTKQS
jgi:CHASE2 domain-containing sensor protein